MIPSMSTLTIQREEPLLLPLAEAMRLLGISRTTLYALMRTGDLPYVKVRSDRRIARADIDLYVAKLREAAVKGSEAE